MSEILFARIKKISIALLILIGVIILSAYTIVADNLYDSQMNHIELVWSTGVNQNLKFTLREKFEDEFELLSSSFYNKSMMKVKSRLIEKNSVVYGVDEHYFSVYPYPKLVGSYFTKKDIDQGLNHVVISEDLSINLFNTIDTLGKELKIGQETFTIVGVINSSSILPFNIFDKEELLVFMPYKKFAHVTEVDYASVVVVRNEALIEKNIVENWFEDNNINYWGFKEVNISKGNVIFHKNMEIIIFIFTMTIAIFIVTNVLMDLRVLWQFLTSHNRVSYPAEWLKAEKYHIIKYVLVMLSKVLIIYYLWQISTFEFYFDLYYDGSMAMNNLKDFLLWMVESQKSVLLDLRNSMAWHLYVIEKIRTLALLTLSFILYTIMFTYAYQYTKIKK